MTNYWRSNRPAKAAPRNCHLIRCSDCGNWETCESNDPNDCCARWWQGSLRVVDLGPLMRAHMQTTEATT